MKKIIELIKKFLFGSEFQKAVAAKEIVKEVKKTAVKPAASKKKK